MVMGIIMDERQERRKKLAMCPWPIGLLITIILISFVSFQLIFLLVWELTYETTMNHACIVHTLTPLNFL